MKQLREKPRIDILLRRMDEPGSRLYVSSSGCEVKREGRVIDVPRAEEVMETWESGMIAPVEKGVFMLTELGKRKMLLLRLGKKL